MWYNPYGLISNLDSKTCRITNMHVINMNQMLHDLADEQYWTRK